MHKDYRVSGKVIHNQTGKGIPDLRIEAWDKDFIIDDLLGNALSDEAGLFQIDFHENYFREILFDRCPDIYFKVFQADRLLVDTRNHLFWNAQKSADSLEIAIPGELLQEGVGGKRLKIVGKIVSDKRVGAGVHVIAFDRRIGGDVVIGRTVTDKEGNYLISYDAGLLHGKSGADIEIRLFDNADARKEIGRSVVRYHAGAVETVNVFLDPANVVRESEYERLVADLEPHLEHLQLADLKENESRADITFLAKKSGWDARLIAMIAQADKLSGEMHIDPFCCYALFRSGVAGTEEAIGKVLPKVAGQIIKKALEEKIIPDRVNLEETLKIIKEKNSEYLLKNVAPGACSSLGAMLGLRLSADQKRLFIESYQDVGGNTEAFWSALKSRGFDEKIVSQLQLDGKLGYLTGGNSSLIERIYERHTPTDASDLVCAGLYNDAAWLPLIGSDIPRDMTLDAYARSMAEQLVISFPTLVTAEMVRRNEVNIGNQDAKEELSSFMQANHASFVIGVHPLKSWNGYERLSSEAKAAAKRVERTYQMSPSNKAMSALARLSLTSAFQVTKYSREEFRQKYNDAFASDEIERIYTKAHEIHSATLSLATGYLTHRIASNVYALSGKTEVTSSDRVVYPALEELFGNMDYCSCDQCKSVLSPAAYMVDLLQFLDLSAVTYDKRNPIEVLLERRPDIQHIQLSCENTNTVMPYIDLVNEILEYYLVHGNLDLFKGHDAGAEITSEELLADPRFVEDSAYIQTKAKVYPFNLPFDQPLEALRLLFQIFDVSLQEAMDVFGDKRGASVEWLGLNKEEYQILTDRAFHSLAEYFGELSGSTIDDLNSAIANGKTFAKRVALTYLELAGLLKTAFINPGILLVPRVDRLGVSLSQIQSFCDGTISEPDFLALLPSDLVLADYNNNVIEWLKTNQALIMGLITLTDTNPGSGPCSFADLELRYALPDMLLNRLTELSYHKLHRFIRIWRKEGWSMDTTDAIMTTFTPVVSGNITEENIDEVFITLLARIANFRRLIALRSLSEKNFAKWLFLWDSSRDKASRLDQFAKLVKMAQAALLDLSAITGIDPLADDFEKEEPSLLRYLKVLDDLKSVSLKIPDLNYLLRHKDDSGKLTPDETLLRRNIKSLHDSISAITTGLTLASDSADFSFAKTKMALVYDNVVVDTFFAFLANTKIFETPFSMQEEILPETLVAFNSALGYDAFKKLLTFQGILSASALTALQAEAAALTLAEVEIITKQSDLDLLKVDLVKALQILHDEGAADLAAFALLYPELKTVYDIVSAFTEQSEQVKALFEAILPELQKKLKVNALRQALTDILKCAPEITGALTTGPDVLHAAHDLSEAILFDFLQLEEPVVFQDNMVYEFYLDAPATDYYQIFIQAPEMSILRLVVDNEEIIAKTIVGKSGEIQNSAPLFLQAGTLSFVQLFLADLPDKSTAQLYWQTKGVAKTAVPLSRMYRKENVDNARISLIRLEKSSGLQRLLKVTARELIYFASAAVETKNILNTLCTDVGIGDGELHELWNKLALLVYFVQLKNENEPEENTWVQILENPGVKTVQGVSLLLSVNSWKEEDLTDLLAHFAVTQNDLSKISVLQKVKRAMDLVVKVDYSTADVMKWSTNSPTSLLIREMKTRIRERCDDAAWLNIMQSISDLLRNKSRDALVTCILYHLRPLDEIDSADKLYEYFLVDVQMDACMKTSRIRLALSTIQLFIQRCLMNLEHEVAPSSIRAKQWEWMKRYRVWEANRRVFLYPENWLEPELRDQKSQFFTELEGELLQSDITDDLAEQAYLKYLKKLDDVARLEIAGMYLQEDPYSKVDNILHLFGRSNGNTRQYYYRRYDTSWTPWEKISVTIEGDHLFPVIWKGQLFVFWLNILEKPAELADATFTDLGAAQWKKYAVKNIEINMCWAEYYKGRWSSPKSSELGKPMVIENVPNFNKNSITLCSRREKIAGSSGEKLVFNLYYRNYNKDFTIIYTSKNCPPIIQSNVRDNTLYQKVRQFNYDLYLKEYETTSVYPVLDANSLLVPVKTLQVGIDQPAFAQNSTIGEKILTKSSSMYDGFRLFPIRHVADNQWEAPFFYNDEHSTFQVTPSERITLTLDQYDDYYDLGSLIDHLDIPPLEENGYKPDPIGPISDLFEKYTAPSYTMALPGSGLFMFDQVTFGSAGKYGPQTGSLENIYR
jgi:hypothetical protein